MGQQKVKVQRGGKAKRRTRTPPAPLNQDCETTLAAALEYLVPSKVFDDAAREAVKLLGGAVKKAFENEAWIMPFGSVLQGVHSQNSDVDLCVHVPGVDACKRGNVLQVAALKKLVGFLPRCFNIVEKRFFKHIKVPIIILRFDADSGQSIELDVSIGVYCDGVEKGLIDRVVRALLAQAPMSLPIVRLVKQWAKVEGLNEAFAGFLNSLGWTLLVIFWLMQRDDISHNALSGIHGDSLQLDTTGAIPPPLTDTSPSSLKSELLADFFRSVAKYQEFENRDLRADGPWGISLMGTKLKQWFDEEPAPFFLEDPAIKLKFERSKNVARCLRWENWKKTLTRCREASRILRRGGSSAVQWAQRLVPTIAKSDVSVLPWVPWVDSSSDADILSDGVPVIEVPEVGRPKLKRRKLLSSKGEQAAFEVPCQFGEPASEIPCQFEQPAVREMPEVPNNSDGVLRPSTSTPPPPLKQQGLCNSPNSDEEESVSTRLPMDNEHGFADSDEEVAVISSRTNRGVIATGPNSFGGKAWRFKC